MKQNDERMPKMSDSNNTSFTTKHYLLLGALSGCLSAFISFTLFDILLSLKFIPIYALNTSIIGAFFGFMLALLVGKYEKSKWSAVLAAASVGLITPVCLLQIMMLLVGFY